MSRKLKWGTSVILLLLCIQVSAQTSTSREYHIKAAFLYTFTQFIEWPNDAFEHASAPFVIGILGEDPFGSILDETVAGEKVKGHPILIQRYSNTKELKRCHILFISKRLPNTEGIISALANQRTLTVSDTPDFARRGGMIRFMMQGNKTRFEINPSVAKAADIRISSKLLSVAEVVQ